MQEEKFIAKSPILKEILNSANLLKTLQVNALISGEVGTGKKTLAKHIDPNAEIYDAKSLQEDISDNVVNIKDCTLIVDKIENITNIANFINWANNNNVRVLATSYKNDAGQVFDEFFSIFLDIPPLKERVEDIKPLSDKFAKEAAQVLTKDDSKPKKLIINTSQNAHSLRQSIFFSYLFDSLGENDIMLLLEKFVTERMEKDNEGENHYRDLLYIFEAPLLKASQKKYKSQLQMAKHLGLNRITLRKKLESHRGLI